MAKEYLAVDGYNMEPFTYTLSRNPKIWFKFHPPIAVDELMRGKLFEPRYISDRWIAPHVDWFQVAVTELSLLFDGTNFEDDEWSIPDGHSSTQDIETFFEMLPYAVVEEIWYGMYDRFKDWGPKQASPEERRAAA
jgi:hypothetical protein